MRIYNWVYAQSSVFIPGVDPVKEIGEFISAMHSGDKSLDLRKIKFIKEGVRTRGSHNYPAYWFQLTHVDKLADGMPFKPVVCFEVVG